MSKKAMLTLVAAFGLVGSLWLATLVGAGPLARPLLQGGAPTVVSYQGLVKVDGVPYNGIGYFKFAVVDSTGTHWSNAPMSGGQPNAAVSLAVSGGLFNVLLGDTALPGMTQALTPTVFGGTDRYLRVWFSSDNTTFTQLSPDRRIGAVPYALQAEEARNADTVDGQHASDFWNLAGNAGTSPITDFVGTTDGASLTLAVSGAPALRLVPHINGPNLIGGHSSNGVSPGVYGAAIGGGAGNLIAGTGNYATVDGGTRNTASGFCSTVGGGDLNVASRNYASVGGGMGNVASQEYTVVAGGVSNQANAAFAAIGGGANNSTDNRYATVGGGESNTAGGLDSTIGGGNANSAGGVASTISGGGGNAITGSGLCATISGGSGNAASQEAATVGGGAGNTADNSYATVGGGEDNIASGLHSTIGGGGHNVISFMGGDFATVSGGNGNAITGTAGFATISGGRSNVVTGIAYHATIGGGVDNIAAQNGATVSGGGQNSATGNGATIGGGVGNIVGGECATISGGWFNLITATGTYATIGGGESNIASGYRSTIGGGYRNVISAAAPDAAIPGGSDNLVEGAYSFAAGRMAIARGPGSFVWSCSTGGATVADGQDIFVAQANGGFWFGAATGSSTISRTLDLVGNNTFISTTTGAKLTTGGLWTDASDRDSKENLAAVDEAQILALLADLPIQTWNFKAEDPSVRHMGPMAQDFYAAFGLGQDDRHIAALDSNGVALVSVQALYQLVQEQDARLAAQAERIAALEGQLTAQQERLAALERAASSKPATGPAQGLTLPGIAGMLGLALLRALRAGR